MDGAAAGRPDFVSLLLRDLRPEGPWVPPKSWECIESESGRRVGASVGIEPAEAPCDPLVVSVSSLALPFAFFIETVLVRLALNALQGVGSSLDDIEKVSLAFCSSSADRTCHGNPNLWHRSSSMNALGRLLKSVARAGLIFFLLRKFVDYFLGREQSIKVQYPRKGSAKTSQFAKQEEREIQKDEMGANPPFSLVNQAFAVAVGKILEGYLCSLNTVFASVKYRRSGKMMEKSAHISLNGGSFTSALSEITLLEVYLHTKELRTRIEVLGNICGLRTDNLAFSEFSGEGFAVKTNLEFDSFPRGADLLTYLYLHLRNADPIHHSLFKFLFVRSCEPYCHFIRSWIYKAKISDPYKEFVVECSDKSSYLYGTSTTFVKTVYEVEPNQKYDQELIGLARPINELHINELVYPNLEGDPNKNFLSQERDYTPVPCFLKHVSVPLLRAGQQLKVLIKLLDLCNSSVSEERSCGQVNVSCDLTSLEDVLPHWSDSLSDPVPCLSMLTFSGKDAEAMIKKRESVYKTMYSNLQLFFKGLDARCQPIKQTVIPFGYAPFYSDKKDIVDSQISSDNDENVGVSFEETEASSSADGSSYGMDLKQTSDDSTFTDSEVTSEPETTDLHDINIEQNHFSATPLSSCNGIERIQTNLSVNENSWASVFAFLGRPEPTPKKCEKADLIKSINSGEMGVKLNQFFDPLGSAHANRAKTTRTLCEDSSFRKPWPLGGLSENPFDGKEKYQSQNLSPYTVMDENVETENSNAVKIYTLNNFKLEQTAKEAELCHGHVTSVKNSIGHSWNLQSRYDLSANPVQTKAFWLRNFRYNKRSYLPYFDFSLVEDPYEVFSERLASLSGSRLQNQHKVPLNSTSKGANEQATDNVLVPQTDKSGCSVDSPARQSHMNLLTGDLSAKVSGGASWERTLKYSVNDVQNVSEDVGHCSSANSRLPLDVAIEKFIVQGILHQYPCLIIVSKSPVILLAIARPGYVYISNFTIQLLEEGFDLHQHLLALRRYHFMEFADWADSFVVSLWKHKWSAIEKSNVVAEIQRLLAVALQRSSCESDTYHERLHIYPKGQGMVPLSFSAIGTFEFIGLGYKVDWPISIIVTQDALNVYSEIFNFLLQVRLAVFSVSSLWHSLKALVHSIGSRLYRGQEKKDFDCFLKIRQQVNHFVSTLQQYLQSQLSDVSWCRFLHSLKHQVNDMLDLESVHMSYLADAQNICFLSIETQDVAKIIKAILQCSLDFRSCFVDSTTKIGLDGPDLSFLYGQINFAKAQSIKATFEKNMKDLYLCYLKSPKHSEFSLCRFWSYLDYNGYYSGIIQQMSY
ncbi:hypothetical protein Taro_007131 [Colocasia esculenta]|uniref:Gamma-tubulin complex component 6 n=1 Tax=Colocasia esculenta TaxID=4460 RepID=A0A843TZK1_COLES|nr:hypothetical protein [Colocasia esculenta]